MNTHQGEHFHMSVERAEQIAERLGIDLDDVYDICVDTDWSESGHQEWLDTAPIKEIADWVHGIHESAWE